MLLVYLGRGAVFDSTVAFEVNDMASDDGPRAEYIGDSIDMGKRIQPKITVVHHFDNHASREACEWNRVIDGAAAFFNSANMPLNLGDVVIVSSGVKPDLNIREVASDGLELAVHDYCGDVESALCVDAFDLHYGLNKGVCFLVCDHFCC